jgi:hypothetical protein
MLIVHLILPYACLPENVVKLLIQVANQVCAHCSLGDICSSILGGKTLGLFGISIEQIGCRSNAELSLCVAIKMRVLVWDGQFLSKDLIPF